MGFFGGGGGTTPVNMVGASTGTAGTAGYVPAPAAGKNTRYLSSDATFGELPLLPQYKAANDRMVSSWKPGFSSGNYSANTRVRQFNLIFVPSDGNIDTLVFFTATGVSGGAINIHVALWEVAETGEPSTYVIGGNVSSGTTTNTRVAVSIATTAVKRGFYYISVTPDATLSAALIGHGGLSYTCNYLGSSSAGINNASNFQYTATTYNQTTHETFAFGNAQTLAAAGFEYA